MIIREILIYTFSGIEVAVYPKKNHVQEISAFLTAIRHFSMVNLHGEFEQFDWMKVKCNWLHSNQRELTFTIFTNLEDDVSLVKAYLSMIRDRFLDIITGEEDYQCFKDKDYDGKLKRIADEITEEYNSVAVQKGKNTIEIVD